MGYKQIFLSIVAFSVCGYLFADDLETNILNFPIAGSDYYSPGAAAISANALIAAGKDKACAALETVAEGKIDVNGNNQNIQDVCCLCRLLFAPNDLAKSLRPPAIGDARLVSYSMPPSDWPVVPFVIVSNIPLCIVTGYRLEGIPEPAQEYLAYCETNGVFRTQLFSTPSPSLVSNALNSVFDSVAWKAIPWSSIGQVKNTNAVESDRIIRNWVENLLRDQATNSGSRVFRW